MSEVTDKQKMHHYMGIEMNIQTWNLLGKENRNEQDGALCSGIIISLEEIS